MLQGDLLLTALVSGCRVFSAFKITLLLAEDVPDHRGQLAHHRHPGDATPSPSLDLLVPFPKSGIFAEHLIRDLSEQPASGVVAGFGDSSQPLIVFSAVAATGSQSPIVGQAPCSGKAFHIPDSGRQ